MVLQRHSKVMGQNKNSPFVTFSVHFITLKPLSKIFHETLNKDIEFINRPILNMGFINRGRLNIR